MIQFLASGDQNVHSRTILIVEDDAPDLALVRYCVLCLWPDAQVVPVKSMEEASKACERHRFDMVLLDLNLPDSRGVHSVKNIRRMDRHVPIIVMTGAISNDIVYDVLRVGANNVLPKDHIMRDNFTDILLQNSVAASL